jgi:hypothetical protein
MKITKEKVEKIARVVMEKISTGEMSEEDLQKGGEFYETAKELESVAKGTGKFRAIKPFDKYQGPYALLTNGSKIWMSEEEGMYYLDEGNKGYTLSKKELADFYKSNAEKFIERIKDKKPRVKKLKTLSKQ